MKLSNQSLFKTQAYINGEWVGADSGEVIAVRNPANGETIADVPKCGANETIAAVEAAKAAQPAWQALVAKQRAAIMRKWFDLIIENTDDLATIMTLEQGKPKAEAAGEIAYAASFIEWFAEEGKRIYGETIPQHMADKRLVVLRQAIGVCAAITPWNFPAAMITRKVAPALAAGCASVVKPATETPLTAFALCELAHQAGIPGGMINVLTGSAKDIGGVLTSHDAIQHLSFTGSTEVGRILMRQCSETIKKVSLELGGNAPFIVFDDADLDEAVQGVIASKYRNAGQTCVCSNRIYVHDAVYDEFADKLAKETAKLSVGNGMEDGISQGPLIDEGAVEKVEDHIANALENGARVVLGGGRHELGGTFFQPTILADVTAEMKVAREETFGPLAPLFRFTEEQEVIDAANATEFGLAAYFYSTNLSRVWRVAEALEYGMVGINAGLISNEVAPFGGVKQSGIGREGSSHGIEDYTELKYLCMGI